MPNIEAEESNKGHDFKTSLMAGFEREFQYGKNQIYDFCFERFFSLASKWMLMQMAMVKKE